MITTTRAAALIDTVLDRTVAPGYTSIGHAVRRRLPTWPADAAPGSLRGRHVVVTGASSGLGTQVALDVAALGAHVHLVVRDLDKARPVLEQLRRDSGDAGADGTLWRCDLGDLDAVRTLARDMARELDEKGRQLHALVHNAGAMPPERTESPQGHELTMSLHVLAPVLLTEELLPAMGPDARVVLVTSGGMYAQRLRADDPDYLRGDYSPTTAYARSKRAQVELLPVLQERWSRLSVWATHPGWADTPGVVESLPTFHKITGPLLRDPAAGADTTSWLVAVEPAPAGGGLWHDRRARPTALTPGTRTSEADRQALWSWVRSAVDLSE
jgi:dehydrogenase/reductase SDR family member 12